MSTYTINENGVVRSMTDAEKTARQNEEKAWAEKSNERKLESIKQERLIRLQETDYMANSDYTMPDYIKTVTKVVELGVVIYMKKLALPTSELVLSIYVVISQPDELCTEKVTAAALLPFLNPVAATW